MINSMTGFGRTEMQTPDGQLQLEVRSVNHRYLDLQFKLPEAFRSIETELRSLVGERLKRGKVDVTLSVRRSAEQPAELRVNVAYARQVIEQMETVAGLMSNPAPIDPAAIVRQPGVMEEVEIEADKLRPAIHEPCNQRSASSVRIVHVKAKKSPP